MMNPEELVKQMTNVVDDMNGRVLEGFGAELHRGFVWGVGWTAHRLKDIFPGKGFDEVEEKAIGVFQGTGRGDRQRDREEDNRQAYRGGVT